MDIELLVQTILNGLTAIIDLIDEALAQNDEDPGLDLSATCPRAGGFLVEPGSCADRSQVLLVSHSLPIPASGPI